jgi:hypothetical protein
VRHIAYANLAKCRQLRGVTNEPLIKFCKQDFPMTRLVGYPPRGCSRVRQACRSGRLARRPLAIREL